MAQQTATRRRKQPKAEKSKATTWETVLAEAYNFADALTNRAERKSLTARDALQIMTVALSFMRDVYPTEGEATLDIIREAEALYRRQASPMVN